MKKILLLIISAALVFALCGCSGTEAVESGGSGLDIVVTSFPAFDLAREMAGERANVVLIVPPGTEAHSYEPTPKDLVRIESCDLLIATGGVGESWVGEIVSGFEREIPTLYMLDCVEALEEESKEGMQSVSHAHEHEHDESCELDHEHEHDEHGEHEHGAEYDEHVWTSPINAALICEEISQRLIAMDKEGAEYYSSRLEAYREKLYALDAAFRKVVESGKQDTLIFADRFPVRYFVEEYGLDYFAAFPGCAEEAEPSAKTVAFLIDKVRQQQIPAVLYIEFSNQKMADVICEDTGCEKLLFHSCHNVSLQEIQAGVSYLSLMERNLVTLKEALG